MSVGQMYSSNGEKQNNDKKVVNCRHCKNTDVVKKGCRKTMNRGKIQRWLCHRCERSFTVDEGFLRMRNNEAKITKAIDLYFSNLSSRKLRNTFRRHEDTKISHVTILDWCRRYALKVYKYVDKMKPTLCGKYYADETDIDCEGRNDKFWVAVDWETRFIPNIHYSLFGDTRHAKKFLQSIKEKNMPKYVQTDAAVFYPAAFEQTFRGTDVEHKINNTAKTGKHNVRIETVFMKIKDRVDDFRGLKALWSAPILLAGIVLQHNFIEQHTTTGRIPCELASLNLDAGVNRWLGLIRLSVS